jgi:[acyl-carrier-protein] S-malonyltransferase
VSALPSIAGKRIAFVFPGQGSQKVGMGKAWAEESAAARLAFEEADDALSSPLSRLCFEGPEDELNLTFNTQPALLAVSIAVHRALGSPGSPAALPDAHFADVAAMAGHSLGEYSALVASGALGFAEALRLVRRRGQLMQEAVPVGIGAMAAIIALQLPEIEAIASEAAAETGEVCAIANLNGPGQTVLAGHRAAIDRAIVLARERGARKATLLAVSAPFHSPLMRPARDGMEGPLAAAAFAPPRVPVVSNVDGAPVRSGEAARDALLRQIDSSVRWVESVEWMAHQAGIQVFLEIGPGTVLSGLNRRICPETQSVSLSDPETLHKLLAAAEAPPAEAAATVETVEKGA